MENFNQTVTVAFKTRLEQNFYSKSARTGWAYLSALSDRNQRAPFLDRSSKHLSTVVMIIVMTTVMINNSFSATRMIHFIFTTVFTVPTTESCSSLIARFRMSEICSNFV